MPTEIERILDQMDRAFSGDAWHGPSLMALLEGVSAEDAAKRPIAQAHTIWELVNHIGAWNEIVERRLRNEIVKVTPEMDWPAVPLASDVTWKRALEKLKKSRAQLRRTVEQLQDAQLDEKPATLPDSRYVLLHGVVQHDLYHAGQIAVLKKAF
ncbi:MAG TPA: DinB family protein [Candidatus Acidoferrales bacterium]|jgi:uncharacterized damage-inducible protein DinB|nr:DinB family protein [Candidatus Acidoferrales bacterium]